MSKRLTDYLCPGHVTAQLYQLGVAVHGVAGAATAVTSPILPGHAHHGGGGHVAHLNTVAGKVADEGR